jgi:hypothetical protein
LNGARTLLAIERRLYDVGLRRRRQHTRWTGAEQSRLRKIYRTTCMAELRALFPLRTSHALRAKASALGLTQHNGAKTWKRTGVPILDAIRARAIALGYTQQELMIEAGRCLDTQRVRYHEQGGPSPRYDDLIRMIAVLDGTLKLEWQPP